MVINGPPFFLRFAEIFRKREPFAASLRAVLIVDSYFMIREIYFMVFVKKNMVIIIYHTLPCNVPSIQIATMYSKGYALLKEIKPL